MQLQLLIIKLLIQLYILYIKIIIHKNKIIEETYFLHCLFFIIKISANARIAK